jgi:hypothetical protein
VGLRTIRKREIHHGIVNVWTRMDRPRRTARVTHAATAAFPRWADKVLVAACLINGELTSR